MSDLSRNNEIHVGLRGACRVIRNFITEKNYLKFSNATAKVVTVISRFVWSARAGKILRMRKLSSVSSLLLVSCLISFSGCTKLKTFLSAGPQKPPEEVVKQFVELSAGSKVDSDKNKLLDLCSGEMRRAFERMTAEAFRISYLNSSVKISSFKVLSSEVNNDAAHVAYQVVIDNKQGTDATTETNEREVELIRSQGAWLIDAIKTRGSDKLAFVRGMIF